MVSIDDDLARERFRPPEPGADRLPLRAIRLLALAHVVIGTLDAGRWHLAPVPDPLRAIALVLMVPSALFVVQAMRAPPPWRRNSPVSATARPTSAKLSVVIGPDRR